jgi:hypothetical protein
MKGRKVKQVLSGVGGTQMEGGRVSGEGERRTLQKYFVYERKQNNETC